MGSIAESVGDIGREMRKGPIPEMGALPPNPRNLSLWGQNNGWFLTGTTIEALERRIGLRRNAT
jgi:hypothetical protein